MQDRKWYDKPQTCPVCGDSPIDQGITTEAMEAASVPYGYIKCPKHFPEDPENAESDYEDIET